MPPPGRPPYACLRDLPKGSCVQDLPGAAAREKPSLWAEHSLSRPGPAGLPSLASPSSHAPWTPAVPRCLWSPEWEKPSSLWALPCTSLPGLHGSGLSGIAPSGSDHPPLHHSAHPQHSSFTHLSGPTALCVCLSVSANTWRPRWGQELYFVSLSCPPDTPLFHVL